MKKIILFLLILCSVSFASAQDTTSLYRSDKIRQRFNPIFGNEKESNEIISFIASNLVVELEPSQLKNLDGYLVIAFKLDSAGMIGDLRVSKSYNSWVDYAILGGIKKLPEYGVPTIRNGKVVESKQQVVFSFGSYVKKDATYGLQNETIRQNTQSLIDEQKNEFYAKRKREDEKWNGFTDVNSQLEYDIKHGLKQEATTILNEDALLDPDLTPSTVPTITVTD